ncbi:TetR/AcrR family transcriptional regulator [Mycobacterium sp.]|uniref:TetR/AcrR family transcriptional regulator n=1 Tax=Mycobacterium sp. TaxID=1785 RepID=UPI002D0A279B|nr:TetR/AcrR family transcriptional regulator [Mycobacterium sp.]HKP42187.1 TetR/AcrR family transcriptional regulator [Mycobacterium sp.]
MAGKAKADGQPPLTLRQRNRLRTRRELLDAALEVFAESGYGSAGVENIAARAGASKVTLYSYFPQGRDELFRELYEEINTELIDKVTAVYADKGDFTTHVVSATAALMEVAERPLVGRFYSIDDPALDEALTPVRGHASQVIAKLIAKDLTAAKRSGKAKTKAPPQAVADLLVGAMRSGLGEVARGKATAVDILAAMKALVANL